jgi:LacI family transcriptional regulator
MAAGVLAGARAAGLRVPDDLAVVGFDDISLAPLIQPSLTTVRQNMTAIGAVTADGLLRMIEDADAPPPYEFVPTELVVRGSCGGSEERKEVR